MICDFRFASRHCVSGIDPAPESQAQICNFQTFDFTDFTDFMDLTDFKDFQPSYLFSELKNLFSLSKADGRAKTTTLSPALIRVSPVAIYGL